MIEVELSGVIVSLYDYFLEKLHCEKHRNMTMGVHLEEVHA